MFSAPVNPHRRSAARGHRPCQRDVADGRGRLAKNRRHDHIDLFGVRPVRVPEVCETRNAASRSASLNPPVCAMPSMSGSKNSDRSALSGIPPASRAN